MRDLLIVMFRFLLVAVFLLGATVHAHSSTDPALDGALELADEHQSLPATGEATSQGDAGEGRSDLLGESDLHVNGKLVDKGEAQAPHDNGLGLYWFAGALVVLLIAVFLLL